MKLRNQGLNGTRGYAMAALLVVLGMMAVMLTVAMPTWRQMGKREKEEELIFRGQQYVRAIGLFQRKYAASFPPDVDTLTNQRFLRRKYKDPMTEDGEFQILYQMSVQQQQPGQTGRGGTGGASQGRGGTTAGPGTGTFGGQQGGTSFSGGALGPRGGVIGVASKSTEMSLRLYNGRNHYNEWQFIYAPTLMPGRGGAARPGGVGPGGRGMGAPGGMGPGGMGPGGRGMGPGRGTGGQGRGGRGPGDQPDSIFTPMGGRGGRGPG